MAHSTSRTAARHAATRRAAIPTTTPRSSGVLLHITSLPSRYGIGDLGPAAHAFVDALARARQSWWQVLPLGFPGAGDSPYQSFSAMAGNPNLISPDLLIEEGLLRADDFAVAKFPAGAVDFAAVTKWKQAMLAAAWERFQSARNKGLADDFAKFCHAEAGWLDDFTLFMALAAEQQTASWTQWPRDLLLRRPAAMQRARHDLADDISQHAFTQFLFFRQLGALRSYAASRGVKFIGDVPIFVSGESSDVWARPELFQLDRDRRPKFVAGVPPDYFSKTGQRWGNPLYDWPAMKRDGYRWWIQRMRMSLRQADLVRIDHFRGFAACWTIPSTEPTAEHGTWKPAPGRELLTAFQRGIGALPFIAEDLGVITPDVEALRDDFGLPGMRVLQFGFGGDAGNPFLPHNYVRNAIAYTGTHDNDTTRGWFESLKPPQRKHVLRYAPDAAEDPAWEMIRLAWSSIARIAIAPLQDVLNLDNTARINTPGTASGNWGWRVRPGMLKPRHLDRLAELTETFGRAPA